MRTLEDLQMKQALPLDVKISLTRERVRAWINEYGENGVYISFSGGKDSTVLLDLVRNEFGYKNVPAVFVDVPTQYPELRQFVKTFDNVVILQPKINFFQVCEKYGFPFFGKEISECVQGARKYLTSLLESESVLTDRQTDRQTDRPYRYWYERVQGIGAYKIPIRMEQTMRTRQVSQEIRGGGYDRKYRRCRGIGEFRQVQPQCENGNALGSVRSGLGQEEDGEYP